MNQYKPTSVSHPGTTLKDLFEEREVSPKKFANQHGFGVDYLESVFNGVATITPRLAGAIEKEFKLPALFWHKRQERYEAYLRSMVDKESKERCSRES